MTETNDFQATFREYCKDTVDGDRINECKKILKSEFQHKIDEGLLNWAFYTACYFDCFELCLFMINNYKLDYNYADQLCLQTLCGKSHNSIIRKIIYIIAKSGMITDLSIFVIYCLSKYTNIQNIMCFVKYMPFMINFDESNHLYFAHEWYGNYFKCLGVKLDKDNYEIKIPNFLI